MMIVEWVDGRVQLIDQRKLPAEEVYLTLSTYMEVAEAIRAMVVRGAPAIGVAAAMGVALGVQNSQACTVEELQSDLERVCNVMQATRPTAVNLFWAIERMKRKFIEIRNSSISEIKNYLVEEAKKIHDEDIEINRRMGQNGAELIPDGATVLTHCNAGALATAGYGTALGVIRAAIEQGKRIEVFADETRPFLQGARLTAWELMKDKISVTLITDNMAGHFMKLGKITCVLVGADRIAANGDVANKIGTYMVAVLAHRHNIPFYVAAPTSTLDMSLKDGEQIPIENRDPKEITCLGDIQIAPESVNALNPAFDVTPNELISAIITENGVARSDYKSTLAKLITLN